jgi:NAD-dependent dihydropyrimidine dehydrogenase PreA subunit
MSIRTLRSSWEMPSFPYLAHPDACDRCLEFVIQCPVSALELLPGEVAA